MGTIGLIVCCVFLLAVVWAFIHVGTSVMNGLLDEEASFEREVYKRVREARIEEAVQERLRERRG